MTGESNNPSTVNNRFGTLDAAISSHADEIADARGVYADMAERLDNLVLAGGNISTLVNGTQSSSTTLTVDSTTGFIAGARIAFPNDDGVIEYRLISSIGGATTLNLTTAHSGVEDDALVTMISESEYQASQAIDSGGRATASLPAVVGWLQRSVNVKAFGAFGDGSSHKITAGNLTTAQAQFPLTHAEHTIVEDDEYDWCAIQEAWLTAFQPLASVEEVYIPAGNYQINRTIVGPFDGTGRRIPVAGAGSRGTTLSGTILTATGAITLLLIPGLTWIRDLYLIGADKTNTSSIAVRIGGKTSAGDPWQNLNSIHVILERLRFGIGWYRFVSALYEVDQLQITHCGTSAPSGEAAIYLNNSDPGGNGVSPSAGIVIDQCDFTCTNATGGESKYGVYLVGTENAAIRNSTIRGYDSIFYLNGSSGVRNDGVVIEGIHTEIDQNLKSSANAQVKGYWTPNTAYVAGDIVRPSPAAANGWNYICIGAGTSAANSIRNTSYQWTAGANGTNEYYLEASGGGDPGITIPHGVMAGGNPLTRGWIGRLSTDTWRATTIGSWAWGDRDSLGFSTIYVRLSDGADPDSKATHFVWTSNNEPTWPTAYPGEGTSTVVDNGATWQAYKRSVFLEAAPVVDAISGGLIVRSAWLDSFAIFVANNQTTSNRIQIDTCTVRSTDLVYSHGSNTTRHTAIIQSSRLLGGIRPYGSLSATTNLSSIVMRFCDLDEDLLHLFSTDLSTVSNFFTGEPNSGVGGWVYVDDVNYTIDPINETQLMVNPGSSGSNVIITMPRLVVPWLQHGLRGKTFTVTKAANTDSVVVTFNTNERVLYNSSEATTITLDNIGDSVTFALGFRSATPRWFIVGSYGI